MPLPGSVSRQRLETRPSRACGLLGCQCRRHRVAKALGRELADSEIRVNGVAPGPIATELIHRLGSAVEASITESSPLRSLGTVDEVAAAIMWLRADAPSFTTGAVS
jgi:NAD(P)-dependent dehydrogenase (short-subunit alcohol dehydrogenase family)